jgi:hypothetical protein
MGTTRTTTTKRSEMSSARKTPTKKTTKPAAKKSAPAKKAAKPSAKTAKKKPPAAPARAAKPSGDERQAIAPFFLVEPDEPGARYDLCLADAYSPLELFEEEGHSGNGYAWDSVARVALGELGIDAETIDFDSEAGTFVALSHSRDNLVTLGRALAALLRDERALRKAIRSVPEEDWDD